MEFFDYFNYAWPYLGTMMLIGALIALYVLVKDIFSGNERG